MTSPGRALILLATAVALAAIFMGITAPTVTARLYLLFVIAIVGAFAARAALAGFGRVERYPADDTAAGLPPFFERAVRRIELAGTSGVYFEQLRPRLREIAEQRLASRGLRLASAEARELLGTDAWRALEHPPEGDKFAPPPEGDLELVVEALERV